MRKMIPLLAVLSGFAVVLMIFTKSFSQLDSLSFQVILPALFAAFSAYSLTWLSPEKQFTVVFSVVLPIMLLYMWALKTQFVDGNSSHAWLFIPAALVFFISLISGQAAAVFKNKSLNTKAV